MTTQHASGDFDVTITPLPLGGPAEDSSLGRMSLEKVFRGDLVGKGFGQMLTARGQTEGSAAYVAIERLSGTLMGREGTFALQHRGERSSGGQELLVTIVPDSGTASLRGLSGRMYITIEAGKHLYRLEYTLPEL